MSSLSDERQALLSRSSSTSNHPHHDLENDDSQLSSRPESDPDQSQTPARRTPLPYKQLSIVCIMRLTEPISYTLIFPFINQMLEDMKVSEDPKQIGYYAGVIESLFAIAQLLTALFWGRLSDNVGRKPVMLVGLLGLSISVISFGLQKTYLGLIISRVFAGMMNGNVAILQSIVAEITDSTNFADAVPYLPLCYAIGSIVGPIIGGYLALPAQQYPSLFRGCQFLIEYPYFLPCLAGGILNFAAVILGIFFMEETLETKRKRPFQSSDGRGEYGTLTDSLGEIVPSDMAAPAKIHSQPPSIRSLCTVPLLMLLLAFATMHFQNSAWQAIIPLYAYTRINNGGLGLGLEDIGFMLSTCGFGSIVVQLWIFSPLQRRFGALRLFQSTLWVFTITNLCLPLVTYLARLPENKSSYTVAYMSFVMILRSPGVMCYVCNLMMTRMLTPNTLALGTLNGMTQTCRALAQAVAPIAGSSLFAVSISRDLWGGNLVWVVMTLLCFINHGLAWMIKPSSFEKVKKVNAH